MFRRSGEKTDYLPSRSNINIYICIIIKHHKNESLKIISQSRYLSNCNTKPKTYQRKIWDQCNNLDIKSFLHDKNIKKTSNKL